MRKLVVGIAILVLAGCGGGGDDDESATSGSSSTTESPTTTAASKGDGDLCDLVTQEEAAKLLAVAVDAGTPSSSTGVQGDSGSCIYRATASTTAPTLLNVVLVGTKLTEDQVKTELLADQPDAKPVADLGEAAFLLPEGDSVITIENGAVISVQAIAGGKPVAEASLIATARLALERFAQR